MTELFRVGVDIDGVVARYTEVLADHIEEKFETNFSPDDLTEWNQSIQGVDPHVGEIIHQAYKDNDVSYISEMTPIQGAREVINELYENGMHIIFITHRPELVEEETINWLNMHGFKFDAIIPDAPDDKTEPEQLDILIDDNERVIETAIESNIHTILFPKVYNREYTWDHPKFHDLSERVQETPDGSFTNEREYWMAIRDIILEISEGDTELWE